MQEPILFTSAVLIGLMGSSHCLSMCGGIASAQSFSQGTYQSGSDTKADNNSSSHDQQNLAVDITDTGMKGSASAIVSQPPGRAFLLPQLLTFNGGRLLSYTLIGLLAGAIGATLAMNSTLFVLLRGLAAMMLILMGLYVGQWWAGLGKIERLGAKLWQKLSPVANQFRQSNGLKATFALGMLWGWLPCGLVYSALTWSMSSADPKLAGLLMFGFGVGTLPSMMAAGLFAYQLRRIFSKLSVRRVFASILIIFGIWSLPVHWGHWFGDNSHPPTPNGHSLQIPAQLQHEHV